MSNNQNSPAPSSHGSEYAALSSEDDVNVTDIDGGMISAPHLLAIATQQEYERIMEENSGSITLREAIRSWVLAESNVPEESINRLLKSLRRVDATLPAMASAFFPMPKVKSEIIEGENGDCIGGKSCDQIIARMDSHDVRLDQISGDVHTINQSMVLLLNGLNCINEKLGISPTAASMERVAEFRPLIKRPLYVPRRCTTNEELDEWIKQEPEVVARQCTFPMLRASVRAFIKLCMTRSLAMQFSWTGLGEKRRPLMKICFKDHPIYSYMLMVLQYTPFAKAPFSQVADAVKTVLAGVVDWDGGRKRSRTRTVCAPGHGRLVELMQNGETKTSPPP